VRHRTVVGGTNEGLAWYLHDTNQVVWQSADGTLTALAGPAGALAAGDTLKVEGAWTVLVRRDGQLRTVRSSGTF